QAGGTELFSRAVENVCRTIVNDLSFTVSVQNGIVGPNTEFSVHAADGAGRALPHLAVKAVWELPDLMITAAAPAAEEASDVVSIVKTDANGNALVSYPNDEAFRNKIVCLTVSTALSQAETATAEMRKLDALCATEAHYVYYENLADAYKSVTVASGEYTLGAVAHDKRAGAKEKSRTVTLASYAIDVHPVTNAQYAAYLYTTDSDAVPEYFDNDDYNQEHQPVVGITAADAEAYAAWLSAQTGWRFRLPTDDEWEAAARAGTEYIYPWGDDLPSKAKSANYKGNGKFKAPSPVGSFANGTNAWQLEDMAGNVWEWTASSREAQEGFRTVKGGSWMDGPVDLRISNFKNIDTASGSPDVGFRLVKEDTDEN
ncbi:MAG: SUMF1/EgtB/PvdO family nonheme iron enzyme, partial [Treponema sp.]|nr:SUMF1/EgtB/PvdO family nonheme iron enzyme [Treponema sp.]